MNGTSASVYSFTPTMDEARVLFDLSGFHIVEHIELTGSYLPSDEPISPALTEAAVILGTPLTKLPIINGFVLKRRP